PLRVLFHKYGRAPECKRICEIEHEVGDAAAIRGTIVMYCAIPYNRGENPDGTEAPPASTRGFAATRSEVVSPLQLDSSTPVLDQSRPLRSDAGAPVHAPGPLVHDLREPIGEKPHGCGFVRVSPS